MADVFNKDKRSEIMSRVKSVNTTPEKVVRSVLHGMGFRFRLHRKDLPGKPDIILPKYRNVIMVHGCFWHGHKGCRRAARPSSNTAFWNKKLDGNVKRDADVKKKLKAMGWNVFTIWECQTVDIKSLKNRIKRLSTRWKIENERS